MQRDHIKICVMRVGGSNRDSDAAKSLEDFGAQVDVLHLNDVLRRKNLSSYHGLVFPGGFAFGDYVRAGAIWGKKLLSYLREDLRHFVESGKPVLGICNGFQVLVESGLLPGYDFLSESPQLCLGINRLSKFECRWVYLRTNQSSNCVFTKKIKGTVRFPIAHGEGRFMVLNKQLLQKLIEANQVAVQYSYENGGMARNHYPENPNGSVFDIAGICNSTGNVFGLMPHPENAFFGYQIPDWARKGNFEKYGDGYGIFDSMISYIEEKF